MDNILVCARIRPLNTLEHRTNQKVEWEVRNKTIQQLDIAKDIGCNDDTNTPFNVNNRPGNNKIISPISGTSTTIVSASNNNNIKTSKILHTFNYDECFGSNSTNTDIYEKIGKPMLKSCMEGINCCLFAYGQTSAGKTHTMSGGRTIETLGIVPRVIRDIFNYIEKSKDREFLLRVSYLEIYNEQLNDLLSQSGNVIRIREDKSTGVFVENLKEQIVISPDQAYNLIAAGEHMRHVGRTNYNDVSSRSHSIFRIIVESKAKSDVNGGAVRTSYFNLVDLAGSENAIKAGSSARAKESSYINKSLLALGTVIYKLAEGTDDHIPYRDSKLTRLLENSLSGKSKVTIMCCCSPASSNFEETISTLKFAQRAKKIKVKGVVNESVDDKTLLRQYKKEIDHLKNELYAFKEASQSLLNSIDPDAPASNPDEEQLELEMKLNQLNKLILQSSAAATETTKSPREITKSNKPARPNRRQSFHEFWWCNNTQESKQELVLNELKIDKVVDEDSILLSDEFVELECSPEIVSINSLLEDSSVDGLKKTILLLQNKCMMQAKAIEDLNSANKKLAETVDEKNKLLDEWDQFHQNIENHGMTPRSKHIRSNSITSDSKNQNAHIIDFPSPSIKGKHFIDLSTVGKSPIGVPSNYVSPRLLEISPSIEKHLNRIKSGDIKQNQPQPQQHQNNNFTEKGDVQKFLLEDDDVNMDDVGDEL